MAARIFVCSRDKEVGASPMGLIRGKVPDWASIDGSGDGSGDGYGYGDGSGENSGYGCEDFCVFQG